MNFTDVMFNNVSFSSFGLMPCSFDSSNNGVEIISMGSELKPTFIKSAGRDTNDSVGYEYETITIPFQACKIDEYGEPLKISQEEFSKLNRIFGRKTSHEFMPISDDYLNNICFDGTMILKAVSVNGYIYGVDITFTCNAPYGYIKLDDIKLSGTEFTIYDISDEEGVLYPNVELLVNGNDTLTITNSLDTDYPFSINNCVSGETINIDCKNGIITSDNQIHNLTIMDDWNGNKFSIINKIDDETNEDIRDNNYSSTLDVNIKISNYKPIRKVGF